LRALPTAPVEPPHVGLVMDASALLADIASLGSVMAPLAISASDVTLEDVPTHAWPGETLQLRLALGDRHAEQSTAELEVSLGELAVRCDVTLCSRAIATVFVPGIVTPSAVGRCIRVRMTVPLTRARNRTLKSSCFFRPSRFRSTLSNPRSYWSYSSAATDGQRLMWSMHHDQWTSVHSL